jgi:putative transposase
MPRLARVVLPDIPYHITQRGNRREDVFFCDADREFYLTLLQEYCEKYQVEVWAYCLMTNHIHLILKPFKSDGLQKVLKPLHMRYAQYINKKQGWKGHLWQGRFFSSALDESYVYSAIRYIEQNPVRARMVAGKRGRYPLKSMGSGSIDFDLERWLKIKLTRPGSFIKATQNKRVASPLFHCVSKVITKHSW